MDMDMDNPWTWTWDPSALSRFPVDVQRACVFCVRYTTSPYATMLLFVPTDGDARAHMSSKSRWAHHKGEPRAAMESQKVTKFYQT